MLNILLLLCIELCSGLIIHDSMCVWECMFCFFLAAQTRWHFSPYALWRTNKKKHTLARTHTPIMSGFKFRLFPPRPRQLSSLCSKTPIIHLWHDSILTAPLRSKKSYSLCLSISRSLPFFPIFTPLLFTFPPPDRFLFFSLVSFSLFQLHFFSPRHLISLFSGNFYLGLITLERLSRRKNEW